MSNDCEVCCGSPADDATCPTCGSLGRVTRPRLCPNGCGELVINGIHLYCIECGATPGFVSGARKPVLNLAAEIEERSVELLSALGVPPEFLSGGTEYATSSLRLAELERMRARDQQIMRDVLMSEDAAFLAKARGVLNDVPEEDRVLIESTPYPGDDGHYQRMFDETKELGPAGAFTAPWSFCVLTHNNIATLYGVPVTAIEDLPKVCTCGAALTYADEVCFIEAFDFCNPADDTKKDDFGSRYQQEPQSLEDVMDAHRKNCERCRHGRHCGEYIRLRDGR